MESKELAIRLARALDAKKAVNVHILAVEDLTTVTEYFRHCHGYVHHPCRRTGR